MTVKQHHCDECNKSAHGVVTFSKNGRQLSLDPRGDYEVLEFSVCAKCLRSALEKIGAKTHE